MLWNALQISKGGPVLFPISVADSFAWAHYINALESAADVQGWANWICPLPLPTASLGPISPLGRAADA